MRFLFLFCLSDVCNLNLFFGFPICFLQVAKKLQKKQKNVVDAGAKKLREKMDADKGRERVREEDRKREAQARDAPSALGRFFKK